MKPFAALVLLFGLVAFVLPGALAQNKDADKKDAKDEKKDAKAEKKDAKDEKKDAKGDDKKGDEKKGEEKKGEEKKETMVKKPSGKGKNIDPEEEKILKESYPPMRAQILRLEGNSSGEITVNLGRPWPPKINQAKQWYSDLIKSKAVTAETFNQYRMKMSQANEVDIRTGAGMKVRTMLVPQEFDAKGNLKRWTVKELTELKGNSRLPGYPAQLDWLRTGQVVDLYVPKLPPAKGAAKDAKKKKELDDDYEDPLLRPEVVMIVVVFDPPQRR